jgi:hypothetical protein
MVGRGKWTGSKGCWLFVVKGRRVGEGRRLNDRSFWKKEKLQEDRREADKATQEGCARSWREL